MSSFLMQRKAWIKSTVFNNATIKKLRINKKSPPKFVEEWQESTCLPFYWTNQVTTPRIVQILKVDAPKRKQAVFQSCIISDGDSRFRALIPTNVLSKVLGRVVAVVPHSYNRAGLAFWIEDFVNLDSEPMSVIGNPNDFREELKNLVFDIIMDAKNPLLNEDDETLDDTTELDGIDILEGNMTQTQRFDNVSPNSEFKAIKKRFGAHEAWKDFPLGPQLVWQSNYVMEKLCPGLKLEFDYEQAEDIEEVSMESLIDKNGRLDGKYVNNVVMSPDRVNRDSGDETDEIELFSDSTSGENASQINIKTREDEKTQFNPVSVTSFTQDRLQHSTENGHAEKYDLLDGMNSMPYSGKAINSTKSSPESLLKSSLSVSAIGRDSGAESATRNNYSQIDQKNVSPCMGKVTTKHKYTTNAKMSNNEFPTSKTIRFSSPINVAYEAKPGTLDSSTQTDPINVWDLLREKLNEGSLKFVGNHNAW